MGRNYKKVPVIKKKQVVYKRKETDLIVSLKMYNYLKECFKNEVEEYEKRKLSILVSSCRNSQRT